MRGGRAARQGAAARAGARLCWCRNQARQLVFRRGAFGGRRRALGFRGLRPAHPVHNPLAAVLLCVCGSAGGRGGPLSGHSARAGDAVRWRRAPRRRRRGHAAGSPRAGSAASAASGSPHGARRGGARWGAGLGEQARGKALGLQAADLQPLCDLLGMRPAREAGAPSSSDSEREYPILRAAGGAGQTGRPPRRAHRGQGTALGADGRWPNAARLELENCPAGASWGTAGGSGFVETSGHGSRRPGGECGVGGTAGLSCRGGSGLSRGTAPLCRPLRKRSIEIARTRDMGNMSSLGGHVRGGPGGRPAPAPSRTARSAVGQWRAWLGCM